MMDTKTKAGIATAVAAAIAIAIPGLKVFEGRELNPYRDIVGVWTVCDGATNVEMRRYTDAECDTLTQKLVSQTYAPAILHCTPGVIDRPKVFAATIQLVYNIGPAAYCRSGIAKQFNAGNWVAGCNAFAQWRFAGGRPVQGLVNRRMKERQLCLQGAV